jgi:hypothetical protein
MRKLICICLLFPLFIGQAFAWGQNGHRTVGLVAEQHLDKKAKKRIGKILDCNSMAEVSTWMDDIRSDSTYDHTHDWHWVTVPEGTTYEQSVKNPHGDVIMKIEELTKALKKGGLPAATEAEYLKFLIHLVGDLHQPLHVGANDDMGGNAVKVQWFGKPSNLHSVWDSGIIDSKALSYTELTSFLGEPSKEQIKQWQSTSVREWAAESQKYLPQVYNLPKDGRLSYNYAYDNFGLIEHQLLVGGIRLAGLLNEIYG